MWDMPLIFEILRLIEKRRTVKIKFEFDTDSPEDESPEELNADNDMVRANGGKEAR